MKKFLYSLLGCGALVAGLVVHAVDPDLQFLDQTIIMGSIQFPRTLENVPPIRIYYAGNKIKGEADHHLSRATFTIPTDRNCTRFYLVISENVQPHTEENLVKFLKIKPNTSYKFYRLDLVNVPSKDPKRPYASDREWQIMPMRVNEHGRLPDYGIIICYNPDFVEGLETGSSLELPTIKIRPDILTLAGSEDALQQLSIEVLLSSIENDLIHASVKSDVKQNYQKTIVAMITP